MTRPTPDQLASTLRSCGQLAPEPLYPREYAERTGVPREQLEPALEELRLRGFLRFTDWVAGRGQGYVLTPAGTRALKRPEELERILVNGSAAPPKAVSRRAREHSLADPAGLDRSAAIIEAMTDPEPPRVAFLLILVNVLVFTFGMYLAPRFGVSQDTYLGGGTLENLEGYNNLLHQEGAVSALDILHGEWWRLLSACFVHIGFLHLLMNMLMLYFIGPLMERAYGSGRFLVLYLLSGLVASCFGVILQPEGAMAGASGALCGLLGALGAWTMINRRYLPPAIWARWMRAVIINAILIVCLSTWKDVSWSGHLGGGVGGLALGVLLTYHRWGIFWQKALAALGVALVPLLCVVAIWGAPEYNDRWERALDDIEAEDVGPEARADFTKLDENVLRQTDPLAQDAVSTCRVVYKELARPSHAVDAESAARWRKALERVQQESNKAAEQFTAIGRLHGRAEVARKAGLAEFRQTARFSGLLIHCLDAGASCSDADLDRLKEEGTKMMDLSGRWYALKKGFES